MLEQRGVWFNVEEGSTVQCWRGVGFCRGCRFFIMSLSQTSWCSGEGVGETGIHEVSLLGWTWVARLFEA